MYEKDLGISLLSSTSRVRITNEIDSDIRNTWIIGQMNCGFVSVFFFYDDKPGFSFQFEEQFV
jgi:hypothetical protein